MHVLPAVGITLNDTFSKCNKHIILCLLYILYILYKYKIYVYFIFYIFYFYYYIIYKYICMFI